VHSASMARGFYQLPSFDVEGPSLTSRSSSGIVPMSTPPPHISLNPRAMGSLAATSTPQEEVIMCPTISQSRSKRLSLKQRIIATHATLFTVFDRYKTTLARTFHVKFMAIFWRRIFQVNRSGWCALITARM
jgi:hypothetical protein